MTSNDLGRTKESHPAWQPSIKAEWRRTGQAALLPGTEVWTADGVIPIEFLTPGDRLIAWGAGYNRLEGMFSKTSLTSLVRIPARGLGANCPDRDVTVPATQSMHLHRAMVCDLGLGITATATGRDLVQHGLAESLGTCPTTLFSLHLAAPDAIYASGLAIISADGPN